jgi:hypothetical protein
VPAQTDSATGAAAAAAELRRRAEAQGGSLIAMPRDVVALAGRKRLSKRLRQDLEEAMTREGLVAEPRMTQATSFSIVIWTLASAPPGVLERQGLTRDGGGGHTGAANGEHADDRAAFSAGLTQVLESQGFAIGLRAHDVKTEGAMKQGEHLVEAMTLLLGGGVGPGLLSGGGAEASQVSEALVPFVPLSDVLALRFDAAGLAILVPVVFADELDANEVGRRLTAFLELSPPLAEFGPRIYGTSSASCNTFPMVVYLDSARYAASVPSLLPLGFQKKVMARAYLRAGFVDVPSGAVAWAERPGVWGWGNKLASALGKKPRDHFNFGPGELQAIAALTRR